jgi:hypothetical protein
MKYYDNLKEMTAAPPAQKDNRLKLMAWLNRESAIPKHPLRQSDDLELLELLLAITEKLDDIEKQLARLALDVLEED